MRCLLEHQLSLDADQLGQVPPLLPVVTARQHVLDHVKAAIDLVGLSEGCRQFAEQRKKARQETSVPGAAELVAQQGQACLEVPALRDDHRVEGASPKTPKPYCV